MAKAKRTNPFSPQKEPATDPVAREAQTYATTLSFKPRARLIRTIGDRLISGPEAAVIELVKNSHDADASFCRIKFIPDSNATKTRISIEDDGCGMTLQDIQQKWMEPATSEKHERQESTNKRRLLGSKGIGRFAAAKLGRFLSLETTSIVDQKTQIRETTHIDQIDWNVFDNERYLADVSFQARTIAPSELPVGTKLTVSGIEDSWKKASFERLYLELRRLISPLFETEKTNFKVYLDLSLYTKDSFGFEGSEIVENFSGGSQAASEKNLVRPAPLLNASDYEIDGHFSAAGEFSGHFTIHRGDNIPRPVTISIPMNEAEEEAPCGDVLVQLFIFDRDADAVKATATRAGFGKLSLKEARALLDDLSGVTIYRNGFRVRPYGDRDQDWLSLDKRRVQDPSLRIGHDQVSGFVVVDTEAHSGLVERSSREGFETNGQFRRLRRLVVEIFNQIIEPSRIVFRENTGLSRRKDISFSKVYEASRLGWLNKYSGKLDSKSQEAFNSDIQRESAKLDSLVRSLEERQSTLERHATLGWIIDEVLHEGRAPVSFVQDESRRLNRWWPTLFARTTEAEARISQVPEILRGLDNSGDRLRILFDALAPLSSQGRGKKKTYSPTQVAIDALYLFRSRLDSYSIQNSVRAGLNIKEVTGYPNDLLTALANLIDNAAHWMNEKKTQNPTLIIELRMANAKSVEIRVHDNGPGIPSEFADRVFDVGFSLKPFGSGLGLSIAQEALSRSEASLTIEDTGSTGTVFLITLPVG